MPGRVNRQWLVAKGFDGHVTDDNFRWAESPIPAPGEGQFLVRNRWLSFDPTQVLMLPRGDPPEGGIPVGGVMRGVTVSEVVESRHPGFARGDIVHGEMAWEDYTVSDGSGFNPAYRVPAGIPLDWATGALGLTGLVAYFGIHEVARPKPGETIAISGAAGGVGSVASQLAKIWGLRVIGIAGSSAKCNWLVQDAGVDAAIDYHREDIDQRLTQLAPDGIDIFFDNHGGRMLEIALNRLRTGGRIVMCGITSHYLADQRPAGPPNLVQLIMLNGRMEGFLGRDFIPRRAEAFEALLPLLRSGRLKAKEDVLLGLREAPKGLSRLYSGANIGKQMLRFDDLPDP